MYWLYKSHQDYNFISLIYIYTYILHGDGLLLTIVHFYRPSSIPQGSSPMQINSGAPLSIHRMLTINRSAGFLAPFKISYKAAISWLHLQRYLLGDQASGWITKKKKNNLDCYKNKAIWSLTKLPFNLGSDGSIDQILNIASSKQLWRMILWIFTLKIHKNSTQKMAEKNKHLSSS